MKTASIGSLAIGALASLAAAAPADLTGRQDVGALATTSFTMCKDWYFQNCYPGGYSATVGRCTNVPSGWNDVVSSVKSEAGYRCYIFKDGNCGGDRGGPVTNDNRHQELGGPNSPGTASWNDVISSFQCEQN